MSTLTSVLNQLEQERRRAIVQLSQLEQAISALQGAFHLDRAQPRRRHALSAGGRRRISRAQKARWAGLKGPRRSQKHNIREARHPVSAAARKRMAARPTCQMGEMESQAEARVDQEVLRPNEQLVCAAWQ